MWHILKCQSVPLVKWLLQWFIWIVMWRDSTASHHRCFEIMNSVSVSFRKHHFNHFDKTADRTRFQWSVNEKEDRDHFFPSLKITTKVMCHKFEIRYVTNMILGLLLNVLTMHTAGKSNDIIVIDPTPEWTKYWVHISSGWKNLENRVCISGGSFTLPFIYLGNFNRNALRPFLSALKGFLTLLGLLTKSEVTINTGQQTNLLRSFVKITYYDRNDSMNFLFD